MDYFVDYDKETDLGPKYTKEGPFPKADAERIAADRSREHHSAYVVAFDGDESVGHIPFYDGQKDASGIDGRV